MSSGTLAGFPVVDVTATLYDGSFHDVDSSVLAFQIAARAAFREGMRKGAVRLLEPIMKVGGAKFSKRLNSFFLFVYVKQGCLKSSMRGTPHPTLLAAGLLQDLWLMIEPPPPGPTSTPPDPTPILSSAICYL